MSKSKSRIPWPDEAIDPSILRESPPASGLIIAGCSDEDWYLPHAQSILPPDEAWPKILCSIAGSGGAVTQESAEEDGLVQLIADLTSRVEYLESLAANAPKASYFQVRDSLNEVELLTRRIFNCEFRFVEKRDCENPLERYFEVLVGSSSNVDEILAKQDEWHSGVAALPLSVRGLFRLTIDPQ